MTINRIDGLFFANMVNKCGLGWFWRICRIRNGEIFWMKKLCGSSSLSFSTNHSASFFFFTFYVRDCAIIIRGGAEKWTLHLYIVLFGIDPTANKGKLALLSLLITVQSTNLPLNLHLHEITLQFFTATDGSVYSSRVLRFVCAEIYITLRPFGLIILYI